MNDDRRTLTRRGFLNRLSLGAAATAFLAGCRAESSSEVDAASAAIAPGERESFSCTDVSGLTEEQKQIRRSLEYTDASPFADKRCNNCKVFKAPGSGQECGGCAVVPGPIHPQGYCTAWTAAA